MAERPFRFLVMADLRLDQPVVGAAPVPPTLADRLVDAPFEAARRAFDAAFNTGLDFVLLLGQLCDPNHASPRSSLFLTEQFSRLAERQMPVYWLAEASTTQESWPALAPLPANVTIVPTHATAAWPISRNGQQLATLITTGNAPDRPLDVPPGLPIIAASLHPEAIVVPPCRVSCWIVTDAPARSSRPSPTGGLVHDPGVLQAAGPDEPGTHGCSLIEWDPGAAMPRIVPIDVDTVRWLPQSVDVTDLSSIEAVEGRLVEYAQRLLTQQPDRTLLVEWLLRGIDHVAALRRPADAQALLTRLRDRFPARVDGLWSASIEVELAPPLAPGDDSLLDHYLQRFVRSDRGPAPADEALESLTLAAPAGWPAHDSARWSTPPGDGARRQKLLSAAAWLGADLLGRQEVVR